MKIFCGNLHWELTDDELRAAFEQFGEVENARIIFDFETGRAKGFGFVSMRSTDEALRAVTALDGSELKGRLLRCRRAFNRPMRPTDNFNQGEKT